MVVFDIVTANALKIKVCEALGLDPNEVSRIVIDISAEHSPLMVDVTLVGGLRLLDIKWPLNAMVVRVNEESIADES